MDQKEHITTLCALGTLGIAVAGLALCTEAADPTHHSDNTTNKRKWPGSTGASALHATSIPRRSISQPIVPLSSLHARTETPRVHYSNASYTNTQTRPTVGDEEDINVPSSCASSTSRQSGLRPKFLTRPTLEKRSSGSSQNWLKRLSSFSTHSTSTTTSSLRHQDLDGSSMSTSSMSRPATSEAIMPNKLVKRSMSYKAISKEEAQGHISKRPVTSHQRAQTYRDLLSRPSTGINSSTVEDRTSSIPDHNHFTVLSQTGRLQPFFQSCAPRKRRKSEATNEPKPIRTVSMPVRRAPTMVLGTDVHEAESGQYPDYRSQIVQVSAQERELGRKSDRRSFGSIRRLTRRRNFTDSSVQSSMGTTNKSQPPETPMSAQSVFEIALPEGSPVYNSSPPVLSSGLPRRRPFKLRESAVSEATTTNSDLDMNVFTDEESSDMCSDTNYNSLATRGTIASINDSRVEKLETIFSEPIPEHSGMNHSPWRDIPKDTTLQDLSHSNITEASQIHGIGILLNPDSFQHDKSNQSTNYAETPPRSASVTTEDFNMTPMPNRFRTNIRPTSPTRSNTIENVDEVEKLGMRLDKVEIVDLDQMDWSPKLEPLEFTNDPDSVRPPSLATPTLEPQQLIARYSEEPELDGFFEEPPQRHIFDFSEQSSNGIHGRPKTVHGRQGQDLRNRSSGRRGAPNTHMRSQSVPAVPQGHTEEPISGTKFPTWGLGTRPATETWEEDFDLDTDMEDTALKLIVNGDSGKKQDSVISVKVPQSIIDRQHSVHLQYGQVQEFMVLVEDLKRLRGRGSALGLLNGRSKQLWDEGEGIVNLATINDDDMDIPTISETNFSDPFADIPPMVVPPVSHNSPSLRPRRPTNASRRSMSSTTTPPLTGRTRGDSLAQAKHLLQNIQETRSHHDSSPREIEIHHQKKMPFDTQDLKELVTRSGVLVRALKEEVRRAEGISTSPHKTPPRPKDPLFVGQIWPTYGTDGSTSPSCSRSRPRGLPQSRSAHSYLGSTDGRSPKTFNSTFALAAAI